MSSPGQVIIFFHKCNGIWLVIFSSLFFGILHYWVRGSCTGSNILLSTYISNTIVRYSECKKCHLRTTLGESLFFHPNLPKNGPDSHTQICSKTYAIPILQTPTYLKLCFDISIVVWQCIIYTFSSVSQT